GLTTWIVACAVCPGTTAGTGFADVGVTVQPSGVDSRMSTSCTGRRPLLVNAVVTDDGTPAVTVSSPLTASVTLGGTNAAARDGRTRYSITPCAGTLAAIAPLVPVGACDHRSSSRYPSAAGRPTAAAVVATTCVLVVRLNSPTMASPFGSVLVKTCWPGVFTIRVAAIASWSTASTSRFFS